MLPTIALSALLAGRGAVCPRGYQLVRVRPAVSVGVFSRLGAATSELVARLPASVGYRIVGAQLPGASPLRCLPPPLLVPPTLVASCRGRPRLDHSQGYFSSLSFLEI